MRATPSESSRRTRGTYSFVRSRRRRLSSSSLFSSQTTTTTKPLPTGKRPPPSEVPLLRCARALKHAQKQRERKKKRETAREKTKLCGGFLARLCEYMCTPLKEAFTVSYNCQNVTVFSLELSPGQIFLVSATDQSIRNGVSTRALRSPTYRNKAEL